MLIDDLIDKNGIDIEAEDQNMIKDLITGNSQKYK